MPLSDPELGSESFDVSTLVFKDGLILALVGEFDLTGVERFRLALDSALLADGAEIILDFERLMFIDSSGIEQLVVAINRFAAGDRRLCACRLHGQVERLLTLTGVIERLHLVDPPGDAIAWPG